MQNRKMQKRAKQEPDLKIFDPSELKLLYQTLEKTENTDGFAAFLIKHLGKNNPQAANYVLPFDGGFLKGNLLIHALTYAKTSIQMLKALMKHGVSPNEPVRHITPTTESHYTAIGFITTFTKKYEDYVTLILADETNLVSEERYNFKTKRVEPFIFIILKEDINLVEKYYDAILSKIKNKAFITQNLKLYNPLQYLLTSCRSFHSTDEATHRRADQQCLALIKILFKHVKHPHELINTLNQPSDEEPANYPLLTAAEIGLVETTLFLLQQPGVNVNVTLHERKLLSCAVYSHNIELLQRLHEQKHIRPTKEYRDIALHVACARNDRRMVDFLIDHGYHKFALTKPSGQTLRRSKQLKSTNKIKTEAIIEAKAKPDTEVVYLRLAATFFETALLKDIALAEYLLEKKVADIDEKDAYETTLLQRLISYKNSDTAIDWLLSKSPDLETHDKFGGTPLLTAIQRNKGSTKNIKKLLFAGALPDTTNNSNHTPLMIAAYNGHLETIKLLRAYNANVLLSSTGETNAIQLAVSYNHPEIALYLLNEMNEEDKANYLLYVFKLLAHDEIPCLKILTEELMTLGKHLLPTLITNLIQVKSYEHLSAIVSSHKMSELLDPSQIPPIQLACELLDVKMFNLFDQKDPDLKFVKNSSGLSPLDYLIRTYAQKEKHDPYAMILLKSFFTKMNPLIIHPETVKQLSNSTLNDEFILFLKKYCQLTITNQSDSYAYYQSNQALFAQQKIPRSKTKKEKSHAMDGPRQLTSLFIPNKYTDATWFSNDLSTSFDTNNRSFIKPIRHVTNSYLYLDATLLENDAHAQQFAKIEKLQSICNESNPRFLHTIKHSINIKVKIENCEFIAPICQEIRVTSLARIFVVRVPSEYNNSSASLYLGIKFSAEGLHGLDDTKQLAAWAESNVIHITPPPAPALEMNHTPSLMIPKPN